MENLDLLLEKVAKYNINALPLIRKAYDFAYVKHKNQTRESGEPYINHPLAVAMILASLQADANTICAGLLHDTIEDTDTSKEEIACEFNEDIAILVEGVTNVKNLSLFAKDIQNNANLRKVLLSMSKDVRIIIIKLADRVHNMRTLEYKKNLDKQQKKSRETIKIYAPLAKQLGLYDIGVELEDKSFFYLDSEEYNQILAMQKGLLESFEEDKSKIIEDLYTILIDNNLFCSIAFKTLGLYETYKELMNSSDIKNIHDLLEFVLIMDDIDSCYLSLKYIHKLYKPYTKFYQDYIAQPKPNRYQSLHTTVFGPNENLIQMQIRTAFMEKITKYGITAFWHEDLENGSKLMQKAFDEQYPFYQSILNANKSAKSNSDFVKILEDDVLSEKVPVYNNEGKLIEVSKNITAIDYAYFISPFLANHMVGVIVNGSFVDFSYEIKPYDKIRIISDINSAGPNCEWLSVAKTMLAKNSIKEYLKRKGQSLTRSPW